ncbi:MAG: hypothetical protein HY846_01400 [Nitrosomonadales bacterium]|nr:hypothetical protein [Nitrosomonadales bacterium]
MIIFSSNFEDMANMLCKCLMDFGVEITIHLDALSADQEGNCRSGYALGDIAYPPEKMRAVPAGRIIGACCCTSNRAW